MKNWIKEHGDTIAIIAVVLGGFWNMNNRMWEMNEKFTKSITDLDKRLTAIETIMLMQGAPIKAFTSDKQQENNISH